MQVGHAVVEAELLLLVIPCAVGRMRDVGRVARDAVRAQILHALREPRVTGERGAPLAGGDDLYRMEAEHRDVAVLAAANRLAAVAGAERVRGVLDDAEAVALAERADRGHLARLTAQVYRDDDLGQPLCLPRGLEFLRERRDAHVVAFGVDVYEVHVGAAVARAVGAGDERDRAGPDKIAGTDVEGEASEMQR